MKIAKQLGENDFGCGIINMGLVVGLGVSHNAIFSCGITLHKKLTASLPLENGWDWSGWAKGWLLVSGSVYFQIISSMCLVGLPLLNPKFPSRECLFRSRSAGCLGSRFPKWLRGDFPRPRSYSSLWFIGHQPIHGLSVLWA